MAMTVIKAKFGTVALGDFVGMLSEGGVQLHGFTRNAARQVQTTHLYPKAARYAKKRDRGNIVGQIGFSVGIMENHPLGRVQAFETLLIAVKSLEEGDLKFSDDNWSTTYMTYEGAVYRDMRIVNDTEAGLTVGLTFDVTEASWS